MRGTPNQRVAVAATAIVHVTTVKVTISSMTEAISLVHDTIAKAVISKGRAAISLVPDTIKKAAISRERMVISLAAVKDTPPKGEPEGASVLAPLATILMQSTA